MQTLFLDSFEGSLSRKKETLVFRKDGEKPVSLPASDIRDIVVTGNAGITTPAMRLLMEKGIPVHYIGEKGDYLGSILGREGRQLKNRIKQYAASRDAGFCLEASRLFVSRKTTEQARTLRRYASRSTDKATGQALNEAAGKIEALSTRCAGSSDLETLRGFEGKAAALYYPALGQTLRKPWHFRWRNRRPPSDPVNAMLSFGYALLARSVVSAVAISGLDPRVGFLHPCHRGRPALALDLMEEFRAPVVDRLVKALCNQMLLQPSSFTDERRGVTMVPAARKRFIELFDKRMQSPCDLDGNATTFREAVENRAVEIRRMIKRFGGACVDDERTSGAKCFSSPLPETA
jgi:CRISPR-associated protein Cas1